jgi:hypothetical protein
MARDSELSRDIAKLFLFMFCKTQSHKAAQAGLHFRSSCLSLPRAKMTFTADVLSK